MMAELKTKSTETEFTLHNGIIFKQERVVIPKVMQNAVWKELHSTHLGISKMKQLAREYCYWKGIDRDIEEIVRACTACLESRNAPLKAPIHPCAMPSENWERIHMDYAGPVNQTYFLVLVDAKSKWTEIEIINEPPIAAITIDRLNKIFTTRGYPAALVSDNASIFTCPTFRNYCKDNGIFQKFSAPNHPATNGLAERMVQSLKKKLKG